MAGETAGGSGIEEQLHEKQPVEAQQTAAAPSPDAAPPPPNAATPAQGAVGQAGDVDEEDDANETCGFCRFMKGGGCRAAFTAWSKCVDRERDAGTDFTEECREKTMALRQCMLQNEEYYKPLLEEEDEMMAEQQLVTPDTAAENTVLAASDIATETRDA